MKIAFLKKFMDSFKEDKLFVNTFYIFLNTLFGSVLGFVFWKICTLHFSDSEIGSAASYITMASLLALLCDLGTSYSIIRYYSEENDKKALVNTSMFLITCSTIVILPIMIFLLKKYITVFSNLFQSYIFIIIFLILVYSLVLNQFLNTIFFAKRKAKYAFIKEVISVLLRLLLIIFVIFAVTGDLYVLVIWVISNFIALLVGYFILLRRVKVSYPFPKINSHLLKRIFKFSSGNYLFKIFELLPTLIFPTIIAELMAPAYTAYFYIAWMVAKLLNALSGAASISFIAEGSNNIRFLNKKLAKLIKLLLYVFIISIPTLILVSPFILMLFGSAYLKAETAFIVLIVSSIFVAINFVFSGLMNIIKEVKFIVLVYGIIAILSVGLAVILIEPLGLLGVASAWGIAHFIGSILSVSIIYFRKNKIKSMQEVNTTTQPEFN